MARGKKKASANPEKGRRRARTDQVYAQRKRHVGRGQQPSHLTTYQKFLRPGRLM
jgi:hypothetical protein